MDSLTKQDREFARQYIIYSIGRNALQRDRKRLIGYDLNFGMLYEKQIMNTIKFINRELDRLMSELIRVTETDQPTVYEVRVKNRRGYVEVSAADVMQGIEQIF